jgi:hypothetical protein
MQDQLQNQQLGSPVEQASEAAEKVSLPEAQTKVCATLQDQQLAAPWHRL